MRKSFETSWIGALGFPSGYAIRLSRQTHQAYADYLKTILKEKEEMKPTADPRITKFSSTRMGGLGRALLVSTIMGILITPVFLLFLLPMSRLLMAVTSTGFIFIFAWIMCAVTEGRVYEVFVGTATQVFRSLRAAQR